MVPFCVGCHNSKALKTNHQMLLDCKELQTKWLHNFFSLVAGAIEHAGHAVLQFSHPAGVNLVECRVAADDHDVVANVHFSG